jgi:hypothetical protein
MTIWLRLTKPWLSLSSALAAAPMQQAGWDWGQFTTLQAKRPASMLVGGLGATHAASMHC